MDDDLRALFGEVIHAYLVSDAVRDGVMVEADPAITLEAGYRIPVTFTRKAWNYSVRWTRTDGLQDEDGRLWDVLTMMRASAQWAFSNPGQRSRFSLVRIPNTTDSGKPSRAETPQLIRMEVVAQAYDTSGRPCLTVLMVGED